MAPRIITDPHKVLDVFQPGLIRGTECPKFDPKKHYTYVEHPTEGWRVYLRVACFIHEMHRPFQLDRFIVVKRTGGDPSKNEWEAPKGQMEGEGAKTIYNLLRDCVRREVMEESKITNLRNLQHTSLILQSTESNYPDKTYFQYHIFSAVVHPAQVKKAFAQFKWIKEHPAAFAKMKRDCREKDDIAWFSDDTKIMGKWSPSILKLYLNTPR